MKRTLLAALASLASLAPPPVAAQSPAAAPAMAQVRLQRFAEVALRPERSAPAAVVARNQARVAAEVAGRLQRWTVDAGGQVARGALLAEIDPTEYRLARERAATTLAASRARLALAQKQQARARELVEQGFLSREALNQRDTELQLARSEVTANQAQLLSAERALGRTRVTAPFSASVAERLAQAGEYVMPGTVLFVLTETEGAELSAQLAPEDVDSLRAGVQPVFESAGRRTPLRLLRVAAHIRAPARTVEVRLAPLQHALQPGAEGRLLWQEARPHLPPSLLVRREGQLGVFTVRDGRARFVALPQAQEGRATPAPLEGHAPVVVAGQAQLRDGQTVTVAR